MSTLSLREVRRLAPDTDDIGFLVRGGFPALYTGLFERAADFYSSYVVTYLERDVRNIKAVGDLRDFDRFLRAAALRSGQILSYSDLARDVGVSANTAKSWVSVLEASGQIRLLEPYHRHLGKRLVKSPKLYFMDAGLACHLVGLTDVGALLASPLGGALFETLAIGQVVRHYQVDRNRPPIWFWRTGDGEEVDLLVERGGRFTAVECKLAETPKEEALRAFHALERYYGKGCVERAIVVCRTTRPWAFKSFRGARAVSVADVDGEL
jgi:predicted AAA+ superfamily ATPase